MGNFISFSHRITRTSLLYYRGFFFYLVGQGRSETYAIHPTSSTCPMKVEPSDSDETRRFKQHARIHCFTLASDFYCYNKPFYRKPLYRDDLIDNLSNVAIPGTGIPLSLFMHSKITALACVLVVSPVCCLIAAFHLWFLTGFKSSISGEYASRLLTPNDWFSYWRLNCSVVALHSLLNNFPPGYEMENKWTFLKEGKNRGVPVSPFLDYPSLVVKNRNVEGGMGIFFYKNAIDGGDWIIQEKIHNSEFVTSLLPSNPPLSTFRVITQSRASINLDKEAKLEDIIALSCVFRAGRANASTDHDSILYDVDIATGTIQGGTTNAHWYKLGFRNFLFGRGKWRSFHGEYGSHPDGENILVTGKVVPDIHKLLKLVAESHLKMCPDVPFAGWDVVLSSNPSVPVCLLEVNLSCNFFRGTFDVSKYFDFIDESLAHLQNLRIKADMEETTVRHKEM